MGTDGHTTVSVAPGGQVKITTGDITRVVPIDVVVALQNPLVIAFIQHPDVAAFLYGSSNRESRVSAAANLATAETLRLRKEFTALATASGLVSESEAFVLAKLKYP